MRTIFLAILAFVVGFAVAIRLAEAAPIEKPIASCSRHAIIPATDDPRTHWLVFWPNIEANGVIKASGAPQFVRLLFDNACAVEERERVPSYLRWPEPGERLMGE